MELYVQVHTGVYMCVLSTMSGCCNCNAVFSTQGKLELITGVTASFMRLQLFDLDRKLVCELDKEECTLGSYPVENGFGIHVSG